VTARHRPAQRAALAALSSHRNLDAVVATGLGRADHPGLRPHPALTDSKQPEVRSNVPTHLRPPD
jgi:hypothetical protein